MQFCVSCEIKCLCFSVVFEFSVFSATDIVMFSYIFGLIFCGQGYLLRTPQQNLGIEAGISIGEALENSIEEVRRKSGYY